MSNPDLDPAQAQKELFSLDRILSISPVAIATYHRGDLGLANPADLRLVGLIDRRIEVDEIRFEHTDREGIAGAPSLGKIASALSLCFGRPIHGKPSGV
jgi:hypothetical protein